MKNTRETRQKETIQEEIEKMASFFTAEDLSYKVINKNKKISVPTVYRFLKKMREKGKIHYYLCDRKILYSKEKKSHCHFTCQLCGKTEHLNIEKLDFLKKQLQADICHIQVDVTGTCKDCVQKATS